MTDLADRIADADRRHSEALNLMQERLGALTHTTQGLREQLPHEQTSVLDRIEGSMAELSNRIADTDAHLRTPVTEARPDSHNAGQPGAGTDAAAALRSARASGALEVFARPGSAPRTGRNQPVDYFDMVDSSPDPEHEVIDRESADALVRLYEAGTDPAGIPALDAVSASAELPDTDKAIAPQTAFSPAAPAPKSGIAAEVAAPQAQPRAKSGEDDRTRLEQRFADVATKLDQSLGSMRGHEPLDAFEERFTTLEQRLTQAMRQGSASTDVTSLRSIASQVEDLNSQLVAVQTHFSRLDTIELGLRSLAERLSGDELSKLVQNHTPKLSEQDLIAGEFASGMAQQLPRIEQTLQSIASQLSADRISGLVAQARPSAVDNGALARMVADEISQRMPDRSAPYADPSDRLDDLKSMLEAFVAERRHGDEQTNTMLDTMQQAMIRLLDRMDAIEQAGYMPAEGDEAGDAHPGVGHGYQDGYAAHSHAPKPPTAMAMAPEPHLRHEVYEQPAARDPRAPERDVPAHGLRDADAPVGATGLRATVQQMQAAEPAAASTPLPEDGNARASFIAAARHAARMAAEAPPEPEMSAAAAPAKSRAAAGSGSGGRKLSTVSMALLCLILVGASFVAVKSTILAPKAPQPSVQSTAPGSTPPLSDADRRIQNLEDADGAGSGSSQGPQRRSSIQNGDDTGLSGQPSYGGMVPQLPGLPTVPAALTNDAPADSLSPRSNELPPLSIGPNSLRSAAAKGDPSAEFEVGARFAEGRGVPQDLQLAVTWYQRAAAQGFAPAQYRLGSMFERGLGVKTDLARARVWYQRAAEQGIVKAMHNLAVLTAGRDAAMTDYATAGKWFRAAADHGLTDSQFNLAIMHDSGLGMDRDAKQAFKWFSLAARAGDEEAARRRESLRQKLQPQEITEIDAELANWRPKSADQTVNDPRLAGEAWKKSAR